MRRVALVLALLLPAVGHAAPASTPALSDVLSAVTLDFNGDAAFDRAILVQNPDDDADLMIYLSQPAQGDGPAPLRLAFTKTGVVFAGSMWGQQPSLEVSGKGSLLIKSTNYGSGRIKWDQTLTVIDRDGEFLVAGITYSSIDTLDPKGGGKCDLNLLTGKGTRNGKPVPGPLPTIKLADWSDDKMPKPCQF